MSTIVLRLAKGVPLSNTEVDANFNNLNTDKYEAGDSPSFTNVTLANMVGPIAWNLDDGTLDIPLNADVTLQTGQEFVFYAKSTEAISNGETVMFAGAQGGHILVSKCNPTVQGFDPTYVVGVATQNFDVNEFGYITAIGKVRGLNTTAFAEGSVLYIDPSVPGRLTTTKPLPPNHAIQVAAVLRSHSQQGTIQVRITHIPDTDETPEGSNNLYFTADRVANAVVSSASSVAVGTYVLAMEMTANAVARNIGDTLSGSQLRPACIVASSATASIDSISSDTIILPGTDDNATLSGTWKLMGAYIDGANISDYPASLWLRIA